MVAKKNTKVKKKTTKDKKNTEIRPELKGVILIILGIITLFSLIASVISEKTSLTGVMGIFIYNILIGILGLGAYVLPLLFIFIGFNYIYRNGKIKFTKKFYGIMLFITNTLLLIQMIVLFNYHIEGDILLSMSNIYNSSNIIHSGVIGYLIILPVYKLFGSIGSYVIFISLYIISIVMIRDITLKDIVDSIKKKGQDLKSNSKNKEGKEIKIDEPMNVNESIAVTEEVSLDNPFFDLSNKEDDSKIKIVEFLKDDENKESTDTDFIFGNTVQSDLSAIKKRSYKIEKEDDDSEVNIGIVNRNTIINYDKPNMELLSKNENSQLKKGDKKELLNSASKLQETLASFGVEAKVTQVTKGPSVTRFELQPSAGVKVSKIVNLADDIALNLAASGVRIEAPIPGKAAVGIEVPNRELTAVYLREVIESDEFMNFNKNLAFCLGKDIGGHSIVSDLTKMPHLLVAGATGSGKSVCINTLLMSLLYKYSPDEVKLLLIDPKVVELNIYNGIPHLLIPVVTEPKKAAGALNWAVNEMTRRYKIFADNNVRNIEGYNEMATKGIVEEKLPWIVIIIDELADLMMVCPNDIEDYIGRLAQMARAAGMHLVIATQRPSVDVITGVIKANIPSRISFAVSSQIDSRTILDSSGAEKLLGKGDMLFYPVGESKPIRIQGAFVSEEEVERVVGFIKSQIEEHIYSEEIIEEIEEGAKPSNGDNECDELLNEAIRIVIDEDAASTSLLQRRLKIGYNRAARIIDEMEERGIISGKNGSKPRQVLISKEEFNS